MLLSSSNPICRLALLTLIALLLVIVLLNNFWYTEPGAYQRIPESYEGIDYTEPPLTSTGDLSEDDLGSNVDKIAVAPVQEIDLSQSQQEVGQKVATPRQRLDAAMQDTLNWDPPVHINGHYPPYRGYDDKDYDPNRWEGFEQNEALFLNGTTNHLRSKSPKPKVYHPYPDYESKSWQRQSKGPFVTCIGPRGTPLDASAGDEMLAYRGLPAGFPMPDAGSFDAVGLDDDVCFDRFNRMGPYGFPGDPDNANKLQQQINWDKVSWGKLQNECVARNQKRYNISEPVALRPVIQPTAPEQRPNIAEFPSFGKRQIASDISAPAYKSRTAVLLRTWDNYEYHENDIQAIRAMVSELSLLSGGEYHVILFVQVKAMSEPIYTDPQRYQELLEKSVPKELQDMALLWTEAICQEMYPTVGEWSVYFQQFMPLQLFQKSHPEFDYIWNWEMDARYIGHHYHFFESLTNFARKQARKYLWERNARYYFPSQHGSYENFTRHTNKIVEESSYTKPVWGPVPLSPDQRVLGPKPPGPMESDKFEWGVGEEADLITLLPLWDPTETYWAQRDKLWGYEPTLGLTVQASPEQLRQAYKKVPRRVFINTVVRLSTRLLDAMHAENVAGRTMASELWPGSIALQHGFKAVYAPHPIWLSHKWPGFYLDAVFNADGWGAGSDGGEDANWGHGGAHDPSLTKQRGTGPNLEGKAGCWGKEFDAPYSPDREHNFAGWSWYFWSDFPKVIYRRWMGFESTFKIVAMDGPFSHDTIAGTGGSDWERENGRMCLPGMILHPIKRAAITPDGENEAYEVLADVNV